MSVTIRPATPDDLQACGPILYAAFKSIADRHHMTPCFASPDITHHVMSLLLNHPKFYGVVAEESGRVRGSNFLDLRSPIAGIGPISIEPEAQNQGIGRRLMQTVMDEANRQNCPGMRLVQEAYHNRSLCLYTSLGFRTRNTLSVLQGPALNTAFDGYSVRKATPADTDVCSQVCRTVHGMDRQLEFDDAVNQGEAMVVEHLGNITGYTTGVGIFGHTVGKTNLDLLALIGAVPSFAGPGFLLPTTNYEVFSWCLRNGLRLVEQATLMTVGVFNEPDGAWLPSVLY